LQSLTRQIREDSETNVKKSLPRTIHQSAEMQDSFFFPRRTSTSTNELLTYPDYAANTSFDFAPHTFEGLSEELDDFATRRAKNEIVFSYF
jgi:hypothetical protein